MEVGGPDHADLSDLSIICSWSKSKAKAKVSGTKRWLKSDEKPEKELCKDPLQN